MAMSMLDADRRNATIGGVPDRVRMTDWARAEPTLRIGLLNLMPDAAIIQAEHQFRALVGPDAAMHLFAVRELERGPAANSYLDHHYAPHHAIAEAGLDGLVITGSEPKQARLEDEPFFSPLASVVDWAAANRVSTLFSCLASHAAVLHLDGIRRKPLLAKFSGVYDCGTVAPHPLLSGMPASVGVPHSRWNDLAENDLVEHGYVVLRRSAEVGVDLFVRDDRSLFVFLQGHPEYEPGTLAREYRRDMGRFLDGSSARLPSVPAHYFAPDAAALLDGFAARARAADAAEQLGNFPNAGRLPLRPTAWRSPATRLFHNWLGCVAQRRVVEASRGVA